MKFHKRRDRTVRSTNYIILVLRASRIIEVGSLKKTLCLVEEDRFEDIKSACILCILSVSSGRVVIRKISTRDFKSSTRPFTCVWMSWIIYTNLIEEIGMVEAREMYNFSGNGVDESILYDAIAGFLFRQ